MKKYNKIYIEITNNCNLNCSFCSKSKREKRNMTFEEFKRILKIIKDYTDIIYLHVKGEPLLHPQVIDFIKETEKYQLKVNLTTNGTLLKKMSKELGNCHNLNKVNISLHCENDQKGYLEDVLEGVKNLPPKTTIIYRLWTLTNNELDANSQKIVERLKEYYHLSPETVDKIKKEKNIKINPQIYVDKDNEFEWPTINNHKSCGYCYALKTHIAILVDGTVVPCCLDAEGIINLGNIYKQDLEEIIQSERYKTLQKSFQDRKPSEALCKSCRYKEKNTK